MLFNSLEFALFLPIVFAIYWLLNRHLKWQNLFVVLASYVFYGWWDWRFLILIAFTSLCSWGSGLLIARANSSSDSPNRSAKIWLTLNIVINLLILGIFKYFNFFVGSFCDLFGLTSSIAIQVILPVGISFYTFQALSYSIDVYRGNISATRDAVAFFAYVSFFPQLVAGPIERATNLLPQFERSRSFDYGEAVDGMRRILWGLFKKIVIADNCAEFVNWQWDNFAVTDGGNLALAAILFAFQIYGDFSGYSDIAIGTAHLFGIRLRDNFLTPYFSRNVAEFWKRWHISLNTWFVDYVYIPLGGSRNGRWNTIRNTFVIFLLSGLWHGANWTYVTWGLYHALLFVPLIWMGRTKSYRGSATWKQLPQIFVTFVLVTIGWIIFRAPSMSDAWAFLSGMSHDAWKCTYRFFLLQEMHILRWALVAFLSFEWFNRNSKDMSAFLLIRPRFIRWTVYLILFYIIATCGPADRSEFIYFQF